jgi:hypothetical protein
VGVGSRLQVLRFEPPVDIHLVLTHAAQLSRLKRLELRLSDAAAKRSLPQAVLV